MTTKALPTPTNAPPSAAGFTEPCRDQHLCEAHLHPVAASLAPGHHLGETHRPAAGGPSITGDHTSRDLHIRIVAGSNGNGNQSRTAAQSRSAAVPALLFAAEFLADVESVRTATQNRLRSLKTEAPYADLEPYEKQVEAFGRIEHAAELNLKRALREHPLGPWVRRTPGVGEKQGARLIAALGSVSFNHLEDRTRRGPAELWAYCGFVPGQKRKKGVQGNWNAAAKSRAYLIAESCLKAKAHSPYGRVYDMARAKHADAVHENPCAQCGAKGKPAPIGSPLRDGHKHARALRAVAKEVLKDLFIEARKVGA